jgi:hypothetical protein
VTLTVIRNSAIADVTRPWSEDSTGRIDMFINADGPLKLLTGWTGVAIYSSTTMRWRSRRGERQREYAARMGFRSTNRLQNVRIGFSRRI